MNTFLDYVADDILSKYGTNLSRVAVVFPNKRASLFLNDALARRAGQPLWAPAYITISDLFRSHSTLRVADPIKLVCDLYRAYTQVTGFDETLDHFYGWGQLLIADFDDMDKNMAPVDKVLANLRDLHELDDVSYLNDEQKAVIKKFFANFTDSHNTQLKERFLRLWAKMGDIYNAFNQRLTSQQLAYEGLLYRQVVTNPDLKFEYDHYLFVGFNLLQTVERRLFARLKAEGKAHFYWDFDHYYMTQEAGHYISQYLADMPCELPTANDAIYRQFARPKDITFVAAPTDDVQARYVSQWLLEQPQRIAHGRRTAIVLCNEGLLQTVIHCLPPEVEHVNITTGYPLQQAPVSSLIAHLFALYQQGYDRQRQRFRQRYVERVRRHPLARYIDDDKLLLTPPDPHTLMAHMATIIRRIAAAQQAQAPQQAQSPQQPLEAPDKPQTAQSPLMGESLFQTYTLLNRLSNLTQSGDLSVDTVTLQRLTMQLIEQTAIPFHGEPAVGLQVMGVLETRNLDFDHLLLLSCNEGNVPRGVTDSSFIPYSIRRAYGLTTADHKVAIYAYYFHRLLSRAADVTIVYTDATNDGRTAEMSRFMQQMLVEDSHHNIRRCTLTTAQHSLLQHPRTIERTPAIQQALRQRFATAVLSPTAINRYMRCPLQFYYCYIEGLREPDDTEEGVIDSRAFGNIFHNAAQMLYQRITQKSPVIQAADMDYLLKTKVDIERAVDEAFAQELGNDVRGGLALINREVIVHYLRQLVEVDRQLTPFTILQLEGDVLQRVPVRSLGSTITIGGRADRIDSVTATDGGTQVRVIDYKTGASRLKPLKSVDDIFDTAQLRNHSDYYLQAMLYARILRATQPLPVAPALLFIQHAAGDDYNPILQFGTQRITDVATADGDRFVRLLMEKVNEIFNPATHFTPTTDSDRCRTCPYAQLCGL